MAIQANLIQKKKKFAAKKESHFIFKLLHLPC